MKPKRILLDLTTSYKWKGKNAVGIVRTEREIAVRLLKNEVLSVVPVLFYDREFRTISREHALRLVGSPPVEVAPAVNPGGHNETSKRILYRIIKGFLPASVVDKLRELRDSGKNIGEDHKTPPEVLGFSRPLEPRYGDLLFISGLGWETFEYGILSAVKKTSELRIATVLYDLIPILFPEMMGEDYKDYFSNYFLEMARVNDIVFCISKCTEKDFIAFCGKKGSKYPQTRVLPLGSNVSTQSDDRELLKAGTLERHREIKFALTVGTFEVRKNYKLLLDAWSDLCANGEFEMDLVIVGRRGWGNDDVIRRLKRSRLYNKRIYWYEVLSDGGLSWLYDGCQVFVYPSLYEGWGLPVVEALIHKRPAIISNRGGVPEAGMGLCTIVDPDNLNEWKLLLSEYACSEKKEKHCEISLPTWDNTARIVSEELNRIMG
jgi:glycosyltransferase involved in cell wall biosynthesis